MKSTANRPRQAHLIDLIRGAGKTVPRVAVELDMAISTIYRACQGHPPRPIFLRALAGALNVTAEECRAAIERGSKPPNGRA